MTASPAPALAAQTSNNAVPAEPGLAERSRLTGDWGGTRTRWEEAGLTLDLEFTQFLQGLAAGGTVEIPPESSPPGRLSGTGPDTEGYGGRLDGFIKLDTEKLGWWDGGKLNVHLEYNFGSLPDSLGFTFFPTNTGMALPSGGPNVLTATSVYLSQQLGARGSLLIGSLRLDPVTLSLWIYDPENRTQDYWPNDLFSEGVTFYPSITHNTQIAGRPTTFSPNGIFTTKSGIDFSSVSDAYREEIEPSTKQGSYSIGFQFSHLFHQLESNPRQGWGVFARGAISDGNPNYVKNSIIAGIGGYGLFTPWFFLTGDAQYIDPPRGSVEDPFVLGLRANIRF